MMYVGRTPWHGLGEYVGEEPVLSSDALKLAGLDWEVEEHPLTLAGHTQPIPDKAAIIRKDNYVHLGVVGRVYRPLQNREAFAFMDVLVAEGQMRYHTAGSLRGGKKVWMLGQIASFDAVPGDRVDQFLLGYNQHDGQGAFRIFFTAVRVVCANTARLALEQDGRRGVAIRHTPGMCRRVNDASQLLGLARKSHENYRELIVVLARTRLRGAAAEEVVKELIPLPIGKNPTRALNTRRRILSLYDHGRGQDIPGVRGTAWALYNAVTEYTNYRRTTRRGQAGRFEAALFGTGHNLVERATKALVREARR
jgi:phage/plasmid-like protein (TIGR03299 family)